MIAALEHLAALPREPWVLVSGCFDPLHEGHLALLSEARQLGPVVVAVNSQPDIAEKRTPLLPDWTRVEVVHAVKDVSHASLCLYGIPRTIKALRPAYLVAGAEYTISLPQATREACREVGAQIVFIDCRKRSSTALLEDYERLRNAEKLAAFEAWVREQRPADKPWEPVTDYSWEARRDIEGPHAQLIAESMNPRHAIDVGCGPGHMVRLLHEAGVIAYGCDVSPQKGHPWFSTADVTDDMFRDDVMCPPGCVYPDLVLCREVLEHLPANCVAVAVKNLVGLSGRYVYVTTRFTAKSHLLDFDRADDLDPTHITMLNQDFLRTLFVLEGCTRRSDLEAKLDWQKKGRVLVYEVPRD